MSDAASNLFEVDLSALPEEVTDYAFDQLDDRLFSERERAEERVFGADPVDKDYDTQSIGFKKTLFTEVLSMAMEEKLRDIEWEVERGERDDYSLAEVREMRSTLDDLL